MPTKSINYNNQLIKSRIMLKPGVDEFVQSQHSGGTGMSVRISSSILPT